jgi:hypothetical protein
VSPVPSATVGKAVAEGLVAFAESFRVCFRVVQCPHLMPLEHLARDARPIPSKTMISQDMKHLYIKYERKKQMHFKIS